MVTTTMTTTILLTQKPVEERDGEVLWDFLVNSSIEPRLLFQSSLCQALLLLWAPVL